MSDIALNAIDRLLKTAARDDAANPKYVRVFDTFTEAIRRGYFKPGERIPAESALCAQLPVSLGTRPLEIRESPGGSAPRPMRRRTA